MATAGWFLSLLSCLFASLDLLNSFITDIQLPFGSGFLLSGIPVENKKTKSVVTIFRHLIFFLFTLEKLTRVGPILCTD